MAEPYKEVHYFATSLIGCFTAFSFWQLIKNQYNISTRKMTARKIKKSEISSPSGLKAEDVNNTVVLRGNVAYFD